MKSPIQRNGLTNGLDDIFQNTCLWHRTNKTLSFQHGFQNVLHTICTVFTTSTKPYGFCNVLHTFWTALTTFTKRYVFHCYCNSNDLSRPETFRNFHTAWRWSRLWSANTSASWDFVDSAIKYYRFLKKQPLPMVSNKSRWWKLSSKSSYVEINAMIIIW